MHPFPAPRESVPATLMDLLGDQLPEVAYPAGTPIFAAGAAGDSALFIHEGVVRLEVPVDHVDNDVVLGYVEPGEILGELGLLDGRPRSAQAIAETDVAAKVLTSQHLEELTTSSPLLAARALRALGADAAEKLRETSARLAVSIAADSPDPEVEDLVARSKAAQAQVAALDNAVIDAAVADLAAAFAGAARDLAEKAVAATHLGNVEDKTIKNTYAALGVAAHAAGGVGSGVIGTDDRGVTEIAAPVGVVFALIPVTNPVATAVFKVLSALKTRNSIIMSMHRVCLGLADDVGVIAHEVLARHGLPTDLVLWVRQRAGRTKTAQMMRHPDVSLVLATGGPGMVRAAYSSGTPALGVGSGNAPAWVAADADLAQAAAAIVASKSFDNGLICGAEHNLVVDRAVRDGLVAALEQAGAAVLDADEGERFLKAALVEGGQGWRPEVFGQAAATLTQVVGITREHQIRLIVFETAPDLGSAVTAEKMSPFLSMFIVDGDDEAIDLSRRLLGKMGAGHTAIVHATSPARVARFGAEVPASRILVNGPGSQGVCGLTSGLKPSLTLGCGTFGGNSTTDNVTFENLRNVKRLAPFVEPDLSLLAAPTA